MKHLPDRESIILAVQACHHEWVRDGGRYDMGSLSEHMTDNVILPLLELAQGKPKDE